MPSDEISVMQAALFVFFLLQIKHFLADFLWQTNQMVTEKGIYGARYGIYHSLIHSAGTFLAFSWMHPVLGIITALIDFLAHYHIDWAKININNKYHYTPQDSKFWFWLGLDQLAHQLTYLFLVGWIFFAF
jgi:hypothetical protein